MHLLAQLLLLFTLACSINWTAANQCRCGDDTWYFDVPSAKCYKLMDQNVVTLDQAFANCGPDNASLPMQLVALTSQGQLNAFGNLCRDILGIPAATEGPGVWLPYKRFQEAPKDSANFMTIRSDKDAYKQFFMNSADQSMTESSLILNHDLWREANRWEARGQPGDKDDERDEQCTVLKDVGSPEAGLDSFHCSQYMLHFSVCVKKPTGASELNI